MMFGIFLFISNLRYYQYPTHYQIRYIKDLISLSTLNPVLSFTLTLILFSMAGIPPLAGFFSKIFVLLPSLQNNMYSLGIFAVLMSCIACFYYIRIIKIMYFDKSENLVVTYPISKESSLLLSLFLFLTSFLFLDLELFSLFITRMVLPFLG
jgi:NADH-quinone oxidoreductase subunit N